MDLIPGVLKRLYRRIFEINENVNTLPDVCICENSGDSFFTTFGTLYRIVCTQLTLTRLSKKGAFG